MKPPEFSWRMHNDCATTQQSVIRVAQFNAHLFYRVNDCASHAPLGLCANTFPRIYERLHCAQFHCKCFWCTFCQSQMSCTEMVHGTTHHPCQLYEMHAATAAYRFLDFDANASAIKHMPIAQHIRRARTNACARPFMPGWRRRSGFRFSSILLLQVNCSYEVQGAKEDNGEPQARHAHRSSMRAVGDMFRNRRCEYDCRRRWIFACVTQLRHHLRISDSRQSGN
jgi:hypothetical protein